MPLRHESSLVADSTMSRSPSPAETPATKRTIITYGRRRDQANDPDSSVVSSTWSSSSRSSTYKTGPHNVDEEIPPSSDASRWHSDNDLKDDDEAEGSDDDEKAPPKFVFGWKKKLQEMDDTEDFEGFIPENPVGGSELREGLPQAVIERSLSPQRPEVPGTLTAPTSPNNPSPRLIPKSIFDDSLSSLTASSIPRDALSSPGSSPAGSPVVKSSGRVKRRGVVRDSDSESDAIEEKIIASNSPVHSHPITTPIHSSQTPPTSDDEMPAQISKTLSKGKGKASRRSVQPLEFHEGASPSAGQLKSSSKGKRRKDGRVKPPTKKELEETAKDRVRIAAEQQISIPKAQRKSLTMASFFASLAEEKAPKEDLSSDPIAQFSSPAQDRTLPTTMANLHGHLPQPRRPVAIAEDVFGQPSSLLASTSDQGKSLSEIQPRQNSDGELPVVSEVVRDDDEQAKEVKRKGLLELKQRALAMQGTMAAHEPEMDDDDDDLEIVDEQKGPVQLVKDMDKERRSGKQKRVSDIRKQQLNLGGVEVNQQKAKRDATRRGPEELTSLLRGSPRVTKRADKRHLTQAELNKALIKKVSEESKDATKKKEDEWVRRGGRLATTITEGDSGAAIEALKVYAEKGMKATKARDGGSIREDDQEDGDDEDGSDDDWRPEMRGSASPVGSDDEEGSDKENAEQTKHSQEEEDVTMVGQEESALLDDPAEEDENIPGAVPVRQHRRTQIVQSDSEPENDENAPPPPSTASFSFGDPGLLSSSSSSAQQDFDEFLMPPPGQLGQRRHRPSISSIDMDEQTDGDNEEGEDKENQAVPTCRPDVGSSLGPLLDPFFGGGAQRDSTPPPAQQRDPDASDDDPFSSPVGPAVLTPFTAKLKQFSPRSARHLSPTLKPLFGGSAKGKEPAFSQFSDDEGEFAPAPLQGGFSQLFEAGTARQHTPKSRAPFANLKAGDGLDLTQDVDQRTIVHIDDKLRRKADSIFEKEQAYVLEIANHKPAQNDQPTYVNDLGFLTQTRPDVSSPEIYRPAPPSQALSTQANGIGPSPAAQRHPLGTLSFSQKSDFEESPDGRPLRRLRRAGSPTHPANARHGYRSSPSVSPSARKAKLLNALDVLGNSKSKKGDKPARKLDRSEFVEAEAQESDDDNKFGFGPLRKHNDEEEEDGEDLDKTLEALVDDKEMDEETLAKQRVIEKFKEQEEQADQENEKLHKAAIHGDLRKKRRNHGLGLSDSGEDSEEDEKNKKIRKGMHKKQKIDRNDIKALGENEKTRAFFQTYAGDLMDDNKGLEFLQQTQDVDMADNDNTQSSAGNDPDDEENDEDDKPRYVSRDEVIRRVREAAQTKPDDLEEPMDPRDVSWIDEQMSEDEGTQHPLIREAKIGRRKARPAGATGLTGARTIDLDGPVEVIPKTSHVEERERLRMQSWAKTEARSRTAGTTGRAVGGAAVTGHSSRARAKEGGGSLRSGQAAPSGSSSTSRGENKSRKPLKSMPSMLASVADRSARFG